MRAKFWDPLILPQISVVFKSPTTKIDFVDFLQIQAAFWKPNYTTFSYLLISMYGQDMGEIKFLTVAAACLILFYRHSLLKVCQYLTFVTSNESIDRKSQSLISKCNLDSYTAIRHSKWNSFINNERKRSDQKQVNKINLCICYSCITAVKLQMFRGETRHVHLKVDQTGHENEQQIKITRKYFLETGPLPLFFYLRIWMTIAPTPTPYLKVWIWHWYLRCACASLK